METVLDTAIIGSRYRAPLLADLVERKEYVSSNFVDFFWDTTYIISACESQLNSGIGDSYRDTRCSIQAGLWWCELTGQQEMLEYLVDVARAKGRVTQWPN